MLNDPQLGLFPSPDKIEPTAASDLATHVAASHETASVTIVTALKTVPTAKAGASANVGRLRNNESALPARPHPDERYLSVQDVARRYAISVQTVWRHTKHNPDFPKPIKILNGSTRWRMSDVLAFEILRQEAGQ